MNRDFFCRDSPQNKITIQDKKKLTMNREFFCSLGMALNLVLRDSPVQDSVVHLGVRHMHLR